MSLAFITASEVPARPMSMMWRNRIPRATMTVIAGAPGQGKSSLIALITAELSRQGGVVLLSNSEDDPWAVTRPRLDVAGAILERVHLIPPESAPQLPRELPALKAMVVDTGATCLVLDPVAAHFRPERLVHDRPSLRQLVQLARETHCAVIAVHHTTKVGEVGGPNAGLIGTARAVYIYGYDPADEDRRALSCVKINGVDAPPALIFEHETVEYDADGQAVEAGRLRKVRESNAKAARRRGRRDEHREAACHTWLSEYLAAGVDFSRASMEIRAAGRAEGFGWETLRRAKTTLEVDARRVGGYGAAGHWVWRLPDDHPLRTPVG